MLIISNTEVNFELVHRIMPSNKTLNDNLLELTDLSNDLNLDKNEKDQDFWNYVSSLPTNINYIYNTIPSILEPTGVCRSDGKRPDGNNIIREPSEGLDDERFRRFVSFDVGLPTSGDLTDAEICENVMKIDAESETEDDDEDATTKIQWADGIAAMHTFRRFLEENYEEFDETPLTKMEETVERDALKMRKQVSIREYFHTVERI